MNQTAYEETVQKCEKCGSCDLREGYLTGNLGREIRFISYAFQLKSLSMDAIAYKDCGHVFGFKLTHPEKLK